MAFVSRTTREQNRVGAALQNTPGHVGPGSYKAPSSFKRRGPAFAPFSSTAHRSAGGVAQAEGGTVATPGPGAYAYEKVGDNLGLASRRVMVETPFMSFTDRFRAPPTSENPGPGAYRAPGAFDGALKGKKAGKSQGGAGAGGLDAPAVTWVRVPTAPSIPAPSQSYGYEEGRYGELTMQKPPDGGHTGRPGDTAGPSDYNPDDRPAKRTGPAIDFSRSRSQRTDFAKSFVPGPGSYADALQAEGIAGDVGIIERVGSAGPRRGAKRPPRRTAAFASRVPRDKPKSQLEFQKMAPGPGQYKAPSAFKKKKVPTRQQFFGSTARRFDDSGARKQGSGVPGPGAYMSQTSSIGALRTSSRTPARRGIHTAPDPSQHVGFASTSSRFAGPPASQKPTPGPGGYDAPTLEMELQRKLAGSARNGVFGSTSKRFYTPPSATAVPGPGAYSLDPRMSKRTADMRKKASSMFASGDKRFKPAATSEFPEPGAYDIVPKWDKHSYAKGDGMLASGPPRMGDGGILSRDTLANPGPGQYDAASEITGHHSKVANRRGVMVSMANRFNPMVPDAVPGPGSYDTDYVFSSLHQRTYNISIAQAEAGW